MGIGVVWAHYCPFPGIVHLYRCRILLLLFEAEQMVNTRFRRALPCRLLWVVREPADLTEAATFGEVDAAAVGDAH